MTRLAQTFACFASLWAAFPTPAAPATAAAAPPAAAVSGMRLSEPRSPAESLALLRVKEGYAVELVAAEPMVRDPIAFTWGADGRLWVVEMSDYPYGADGKMKAAGRVRYLRDTDGDGRYDESVLFAEGLNFPTGILPWRDGVLVTAAPDVLFLADTDGDGKADKQEVLFTGFTQGNPQLRVNSPTFGLDNWVYLANGLSSRGKVRSAKTGQEVEVSGRDVRIRPDTGEIAAETGASQFGRRMDDAGNWFGVHNSYPVRQFVIPERYAKRNPHASLPGGPHDFFQANSKVYPLTAGQKRYGAAFFAQSGRFTSACGIAPYRGDLLFGPAGTPASASAEPVHVFTCEPVHNLVQHIVLTPDGSTFTAGRAADEQAGEFMASEDEWFRPVFCATGPDGALWVADMYRFMIEHPDWLPPEGKEDYRPFHRLGEDKGRIYRVVPKGAKVPQAAAIDPRLLRQREPSGSAAGSAADLVNALEAKSGWQRDLTQAMLVWRNDPATVGPLNELASRSPDPLARTHALCALDGLKVLKADVVERALADAHPAVRRQAIRLAEPLAGGSPSLLSAAVRLADDPDPKVRLQLAFSVGEWDGPAAAAALVKLARAAGDDVYLSAAVMSSAGRHYAELANGLLVDETTASAGPRQDLLAMAVARGDRDLTARLLAGALAPRNGRYGGEQFAALGRFLDLLGQQKTSVKALAGRADDDLTKVLAESALVFAAARRAAPFSKGRYEERLPAIALLGRDPEDPHTDAWLLAKLYSPEDIPRVQLAAVQAIARLDQPDVPATLTRRWADRPAEVKSAAADALLAREPWAYSLLERVKSGDVPAAGLDPARRQRLLRHASPRVRELAAAVLGDLDDRGRAKVVERYRPAVALAGDAGRGAKVFAQHCAACHRVGDVGVEIGPNLASVAGWPPDALLTSILDPSRSAEPRYLSFTCTLDTGEVVYGLVLSETPAGVTMKTLDGRERTIPRRQVKALDCTNQSLMPEGIEQAVDGQGMADLIRFLKQSQ